MRDTGGEEGCCMVKDGFSRIGLGLRLRSCSESRKRGLGHGRHPGERLQHSACPPLKQASQHELARWKCSCELFFYPTLGPAIGLYSSLRRWECSGRWRQLRQTYVGPTFNFAEYRVIENLVNVGIVWLCMHA